MESGLVRVKCIEFGLKGQKDSFGYRGDPDWLELTVLSPATEPAVNHLNIITSILLNTAFIVTNAKDGELNQIQFSYTE